ncbi:ATP-binding protein [Natrinema versiforme]|uniref:histidine kinase n=1 Tax=Natrinema versiforme TaxID=88724 RepID=A0A4P8WJX7_9EURY|nr:ATP-binding protein [Natrinema versiforme]QCS43565.1 PAS domain S-box protein [Natrinema versiforme]
MAAADSSADALRSRLRHRDAVADLGQRALESSDLDGTLADAAAVVTETLEIDACSVLELYPDGDAAVLRAGVGWERGAVGSTTVATDPESWAGAPLESPEPIVMAGGGRDGGAEIAPLADAECPRRLGVAIGDPAEPWGVLVGHATAAREFGDHEIDFLADTAALLESAVENERELAESNRTLQRLYAITADDERTFDETVDDLLALGRERLGLEGGFLARIDEAADRFEVTHASGGTDGLRPGTVSSLSNAYCERTIESEDLLAFTDSPLEHGIGEDAYEEWELESYLGGRVIVDGDTYGTLCFEDESARSRPFTPAERSFVELATQWVSDELERRAYRRDLAESEHRYRTLVEHFPNGMVALFDGELEYTLAGGEILEEIDLSVSEFVGQTVRERYEGETRETFETNFQAALEGDHRSFEFSLHGREWTAHAVPIEDEGGEVFAGMVMVQDVTEAKAKQRQLRERESRLERFKEYTDDVIDAIDDVFYVLDETGDLTRWNETLTEVTGYTDAEVASMHSLEFFGDEDATDIAAAIEEAFETGRTRAEATVRTKDGTEIPYEFVASALENPDGEPVVTGIGRDVTDQREYQRTLEGLVDDLEESNRRLEQFAYAASHDLQEPLRMVSSYLTLVERRYGDELDADGEEFIEFAVDGAIRMQEMIDGLLRYSRVDTQGDPFRTVDVDAVVADVLADLEVRIDETDAEIAVESLPRVDGDPGQLRQLFQNLLDNAITYSGDGTPRISVFAEKDETRWMVSVRDRGIGIEPGDTDRIFQVFDRLHSHEEYDGTGIGLALCQRIVERHDGEITVESEPGEGTTFSVALPTAPETDAESATEPETDADANGPTDE